MADPTVILFTGDPTEAGSAGPSLDTKLWGQATLYPEVVGMGGGALDWIEWWLQASFDDATWFNIQVIEPAAGTGLDTDPSFYAIRYTGAPGLERKPAIMLPLNYSYIRTWQRRSAGAITADLLLKAELSGFGQVTELGG